MHSYAVRMLLLGRCTHTLSGLCQCAVMLALLKHFTNMLVHCLVWRCLCLQAISRCLDGCICLLPLAKTHKGSTLVPVPVTELLQQHLLTTTQVMENVPRVVSALHVT